MLLLPAVGSDGAGDKGSDQLQLAVCTDHVANRQGILVFSRCSDPLPPDLLRHIESALAGCPRPGLFVASFSIPAKAGKVPMPPPRGLLL